MNTNKILRFVKHFEEATAERTAFLVPEHVQAALLDCLIEDNEIDYAIDAILDWYSELPDYAKIAIAVETMDLIDVLRDEI